MKKVGELLEDIRIVLTTNGHEYASVEVLSGKRSLYSAVARSPQQAYEHLIKKLIYVGAEVHHDTDPVTLLPEADDA